MAAYFKEFRQNMQNMDELITWPGNCVIWYKNINHRTAKFGKRVGSALTTAVSSSQLHTLKGFD
jgi:hypothetical protein